MKRIFRLDLVTYVLVIGIYAISTFCYIASSRNYENKIANYERRHNQAINIFNERYDKYTDAYYGVSTLFIKYHDYILRQELKEQTGILVPDYLEHNILDSIIYYGNRYNIPIDLNIRLIYTESRFFKDTISSEGAYGLYQIMPCNSKKLNNIGITSNIEQGCYILDMLYRTYGTWDQTLRVYNSGNPDNNSKQINKFVNFILNDETN